MAWGTEFGIRPDARLDQAQPTGQADHGMRRFMLGDVERVPWGHLKYGTTGTATHRHWIRPPGCARSEVPGINGGSLHLCLVFCRAQWFSLLSAYSPPGRPRTARSLAVVQTYSSIPAAV